MRLFVAVVTVALTGTVGPVGACGVYHPQEPTPFPVSPAGVATELPFGSQFDGRFPLLFTRWANVFDDRPRADGNPDRRAVLDRLPGERGDPAAEAADLLRLNRPAEALNRLQPLSRGRAPDFRVLANLAHAHAARGEWAEASGLHELAVEVGVPDDLAGATADQRRWLQRVERDYYRRWLVESRKRAAAKADPADEDVFPLFPPGPKPADAAAVVQQLLLWAPLDTPLYWLLAEVYADAGRVREAATILDKIAESRQYTNRRKLMARRAELRAAVAALPPEAADEPLVTAGPSAPAPDAAAVLPSRRAALIAAVGFALFAGPLLVLQVRRWLRRPVR